MSLRESSTLTAAQLAANRANAQKSSGPRTAEGKRRVSLNGLKHGRYAELKRETMLALGEDPEEFQQMYEELLAAYQPHDALGQKLVEDLAKLYWRQARWERAADGMLSVERQQFELEQEARAQGKPSRGVTIARDYFAQHGMRWHLGSPRDFERLLELLETVRQRVEQRNFAEDLNWVFELLYGESPTHRGQLIWFLWRYVQNAQYTGKPLPDTACEVLAKELDEERAAIRESAERWERSRPELAPAEREARLMPANPHWAWLTEEGHKLDRAIDRKLRLLMLYKKQKTEVALRQAQGPERSRGGIQKTEEGIQKDSGFGIQDSEVAETIGNLAQDAGMPPRVETEGAKPESPLPSTRAQEGSDEGSV